MKKILFILICTLSLFFSVNLETHVHAKQNGHFVAEAEVGPEANAPITRWWHETFPIPYEGPTKYLSIVRIQQCFEGYLSAVNLGGGLFRYEGYLYPCDGDRPIPPAKKPVEEESE